MKTAYNGSKPAVSDKGAIAMGTIHYAFGIMLGLGLALVAMVSQILDVT